MKWVVKLFRKERHNLTVTVNFTENNEYEETDSKNFVSEVSSFVGNSVFSLYVYYSLLLLQLKSVWYLKGNWVYFVAYKTLYCSFVKYSAALLYTFKFVQCLERRKLNVEYLYMNGAFGAADRKTGIWNGAVGVVGSNIIV